MFGQEFTQKWGKHMTHIRLREDRLDYRSKTAKTNEEYVVHYSSLVENPVRRSFKAGWISREVIAGILMCLLVAFPTFLGFYAGGVGPFSVMFSCGLLVCLWLTVWKFRQLRAEAYDVWIYGLSGGGVAFTVLATVPSESEVDVFRGKLEKLIKKHALNPNLSTGETVAAQIQQLHQLHETGVLSAQEFEAAKLRVLQSQEAPREIGFQSGGGALQSRSA